MSDLSKLLTVAHLSWATWAIDSQLLFWHERPERFAHSCSFVLSDLSESLTVTHLIWAIWANEQMTDERIPSPCTMLPIRYIFIGQIPKKPANFAMRLCQSFHFQKITGTLKWRFLWTFANTFLLLSRKLKIKFVFWPPKMGKIYFWLGQRKN